MSTISMSTISMSSYLHVYDLHVYDLHVFISPCLHILMSASTNFSMPICPCGHLLIGKKTIRLLGYKSPHPTIQHYRHNSELSTQFNFHDTDFRNGMRISRIIHDLRDDITIFSQGKLYHFREILYRFRENHAYLLIHEKK